MAKALNENDLQAASGGIHSVMNDDGSVSVWSEGNKRHIGTLLKDDASEENLKAVCRLAGDESGAGRFYGSDMRTRLKANSIVAANKEWSELRK